MRSGDTGFSLIELVAVLLIVSALAVFAAPRLNVTGFSQYSFHQELMAAMRHAQKTANASGCDIQVRVDTAADSYRTRFTGEANGASTSNCDATSLAKPGGAGNLEGDAPDGVDITSTTSTTFTINSFGVPDGKQVIQFGSDRQVVIEANTGYVHD